MRKLITLLAVLTLAAPLMFYGCSGDDGAAGAQGPAGPPGPGVAAPFNLESCAICHNDQTIRDGAAHQADYDQRFQDQVIVVSNMAYTYTVNAGADNTHSVSFQLTKNGLDFDCTQITTGAPDDSLSIGFAAYDNATRTFDPPGNLPLRLSLGSQGDLTYVAGTNTCTSTVSDNVVFTGDPTIYHAGDLSAIDGIIEINGRDDRQGTLPSPSRVQLALFPFAGLLKTGTPANVGFVSAANVDGCQKCHTVPYLKHGFIYGRIGGVAGDNTTDFYTCKGCHMDNGPGGHSFWQELVDDPALAARDFNGTLTTADETTIATKYGYKTRLMNDVHMSHAMEFEYPQSMSSCVTCHEGKLDQILTDANFTAETCKSCHPVTGSSLAEKPQPSLQTIWTNVGATFHNASLTCNASSCHAAGGGALTFSEIHNGYDKKIYAANGTRYSSSIAVTVDNASFVDNTHILTFAFSATGAVGAVDSANITPTVLVGLYAYGTKDYLFGPHETLNGQRLLEFSTATPAPSNNSPRITVTGGSGTWNVTADLSTWAGYIDNGSVKRVEVAVMPSLKNADNVVIALNAPSRTFNLGTKAFEPTFFGNSIVRVPGGSVSGEVSGCNNCHDALATTFHTPDRGGNVVVCRLCHITKAAGSHLELQSRSIDSYVHAIHRFQAFNTGSIDFTDPVALMFYQLHVESNFPTFGIEDCRACHNVGKFNVPSQALSLPGVLSDTDFGTVREIGTIPGFSTGPATRACGACHRAEAIIANEGFGDSVKLANINSHMGTFGYLVETPPADILDVIFQVFATIGAEGAVLPAP